MKPSGYLLDTHALIFWVNRHSVSADFIRFFDEQDRNGALYLSTISFWEIALLVQKGRLAIADLHTWKDELLANSGLQLLVPTATDMIDSTLLPPHHKDPFDRLLIAQARQQNLVLVTQDQAIQRYDVAHHWL
jgi:PIN domain nuclease of toxin-antitoxin system